MHAMAESERADNDFLKESLIYDINATKEQIAKFNQQIDDFNIQEKANENDQILESILNGCSESKFEAIEKIMQIAKA